MNLTRLLSVAARSRPSHEALVLPDTVLDYRELEERVRRVAGALGRLGLRQNDAVALFLPNSWEFVAAYLGALRLGLVVVPVNAQLQGAELAHILRVSAARVLIYQGRLSRAVREAARHLDPPEIRVTVDGTAKGEITFEDLLADGPSHEEILDLPEDHPAAMIFTHAVDGISRGAILTHRSLEANALDSGFHLLTGENGRLMTALPLFHTYGMTVGVLAAFAEMGTAYVVTRYHPREILELIQRWRPAVFCTVPTLYAGMLGTSNPGRHDLASVRTWVAGGMALPEPIQRAFESLSGAVLREGYGLTEGSPVCAFNYPPRPRKIGSIGLPYRGVEARIVDPEDPQHRELPRDTEGELVVRGANVFQGYHHDPEMSAWKMRGGWLHTEDLGRMDSEGYIFLTGMCKPMLLSGGFNVYPAEVRRYLEYLPQVEEVLEIDGVPDMAYGQLVRARVRLAPGVELDASRLTSLALRQMAPYKVPRIWKIEPSLRT